MQSEDKNLYAQPFFIRTVANRLTKLGLSVIPTNENKEPTVPTWKPFQEKIPDTIQINNVFSKDTFGIAIICGRVSGNLELLDVDCKYDLTSNMWVEFATIVRELAPGLLDKLVIEKTTNNGFHLVYRCAQIEGSLKLASRPATEEEQKLNPKEKQKVLFETKGEGGYFVCAPTHGYAITNGSFDNIPEITPEEREILFQAASSFDTTPKVFTPPQQKNNFIPDGLSPFDDYNQRGDCVALLQQHGWSITFQRGAKTFLKRPGDTKAKQSGNFDSEKNWFSVFSTSTEFEIRKAYLPYAVFAMLECKADFPEAAKRLSALGFGEKKKKSPPLRDKFFTAENNTAIDDDFDVSSIVINALDLLKLNQNKPQYLLAPIIPKIGTGVLAGMPDTGKSQWVRQLCEHIISCMAEFLGFPLTATHNRALYIATEDDSINTAFLLHKQMEGLGQNANENLSFIFADTLSQEEILLALDEHLTAKPCDLVIVDSFGDIFSFNDTNNSIAMRRTVKNFDRFAKKHQCFILFVHHINKNAYKQSPHQMHIMGGAGLVQKVRLAMQLSQGEDLYKYFSIVKGNYCPREIKQNAMQLSFDDKHFIFTRTGTSIPIDSLKIDEGKNKDTKYDKLVRMADEIFGSESFTNTQFCKKYCDVIGKGIAQAKRDLKAMHELEVVIKDGKLYRLNDSAGSTSAESENPEPAV